MTGFLNYSVPDGVTLENDPSGNLRIKDSGVTTAKLNNLAVTTAKLDDLAVTTGKIADLAVTDVKHAADLITKVGAAVDVVPNTNVQATEDGVLTVSALRDDSGGANDEGEIQIRTDANNPPTTIVARAQNEENAENEQGSFYLSAVIKAGNFYRVHTTQNNTFVFQEVKFTPLG